MAPPSASGRSDDAFVGQKEIVLVRGTVMSDLPLALNRVAIVAEAAGEALGKVQWREVVLLAQQSPLAVEEAHLIHANDAARVEVMLAVVAATESVGHDAHAVGRVRTVDMRALHQVSAANRPVEFCPASRTGGLGTGKARLNRPRPDQRRERPQGGNRFLPCLRHVGSPSCSLKS